MGTVRVLNRNALPSVDEGAGLVIVAANATKYCIPLTRDTVAVMVDNSGNITSLPLFSTPGLGAPSIVRRSGNAVDLSSLPKNIRHILEAGISPQGKKITTWGAIKKGR